MTRAGYRNYVLGVLVLVNMFNFIDRNIVSVLLQQIKDDFQTSDAQMGLLTGMAFVVVHGLFGIPIARWADRGSRRVVIATGVAVWSAMTALSVYAMGLYLGIMFGYLVAGWLGQFFGWRVTLIAVGLPGLALAALIAATVKEPARTTTVESHRFFEVVGFLLRRPAWLALLVAGSFHAAVGYSINIWAPTFLLRVHGMSYGARNLAGTAHGDLRRRWRAAPLPIAWGPETSAGTPGRQASPRLRHCPPGHSS